MKNIILFSMLLASINAFAQSEPGKKYMAYIKTDGLFFKQGILYDAGDSSVWVLNGRDTVEFYANNIKRIIVRDKGMVDAANILILGPLAVSAIGFVIDPLLGIILLVGTYGLASPIDMILFAASKKEDVSS